MAVSNPAPLKLPAIAFPSIGGLLPSIDARELHSKLEFFAPPPFWDWFINIIKEEGMQRGRDYMYCLELLLKDGVLEEQVRPVFTLAATLPVLARHGGDPCGAYNDISQFVIKAIGAKLTWYRNGKSNDPLYEARKQESVLSPLLTLVRPENGDSVDTLDDDDLVPIPAKDERPE
jgi:hypothetical protein